MKALAILFLTFLLAWPHARAMESRSDYSFFAGTGYLLQVPGVFRLRIHSYELGTYGAAVGATKFFPFGSNFHAFFGPGLGIVNKVEGGVLGGMGLEYPLLWGFGLRLELYSYVGFSGFTFSTGTVGLAIGL